MGLIELAAPDQHALAFAEVEIILVKPFEPCMLMTVGKEEEEPFDLDAFAIGKKFLQATRAEVRHSLNQHIDLMESLATWQFIKQFKQGALRRR